MGSFKLKETRGSLAERAYDVPSDTTQSYVSRASQIMADVPKLRIFGSSPSPPLADTALHYYTLVYAWGRDWGRLDRTRNTNNLYNGGT
jgi:hypothetical protein